VNWKRRQNFPEMFVSNIQGYTLSKPEDYHLNSEWFCMLRPASCCISIWYNSRFIIGPQILWFSEINSSIHNTLSTNTQDKIRDLYSCFIFPSKSVMNRRSLIVIIIIISNLSNDRSKASSKTIPPHSAI